MISNLDFGVTELELREACEEFGDVVQAKIVRNRWNGRSRGFGFVIYSLPLQATVAIEDMTGRMFNGRACVVKNAFKAGSREALAMEDSSQPAEQADHEQSEEQQQSEAEQDSEK